MTTDQHGLVDASTTSDAPAPSQPRIELRRPGDPGTFVDGGWWPASLDLTAELPALLHAVEAAGYGEVRRVNYALDSWDERAPRKTTTLPNRIVKFGGFRSQDSTELTLIDSSGWKRVTILVVPPDTDAAVAHRALALAGANGDRHHAREILHLADQPRSTHSGRSACVDDLAAAAWESEGGGST